MKGIFKFILYKLRMSLFLHTMIDFIVFRFNKIRMNLNYMLFRKITLFYIEFIITTRCTLKCRDCTGYIPLIEDEFHHTMTFGEYKLYLDNLLSVVHNIDFFKILGGEPLLNKDFEKILEYTCMQSKIRHIHIATNGTVTLKESTAAVLARFSRKAVIDISNYSSNKDLEAVLKAKEIQEMAQKYNFRVLYSDGLTWHKLSPIKYKKRPPNKRKKYFLSCSNVCYGVNAGKLFPCMRAGVFFLRKIGHQEPGKDYIDISTHEYLTGKPGGGGDIIDFFNNADFDACDYCSRVEDKKTAIMPAIQI